jgi:hypothetical protein
LLGSILAPPVIGIYNHKQSRDSLPAGASVRNPPIAFHKNQQELNLQRPLIYRHIVHPHHRFTKQIDQAIVKNMRRVVGTDI